MGYFLAEMIGTCLLVLLGNGVVANTLLTGSKGLEGGWIVVALGWAMAVFVAVFVVSDISGAHINPAVSIGLATGGEFPWKLVPVYILGQMTGAALGASLVYLNYRQHFAATEDADLKLACFCTAPAIRHYPDNLTSEIIGTFVLVFGVLYLAGPEWSVAGLPTAHFDLGALGAFPVALLVLAIGLSLGGTTGYAINPARDLAPRIMHALLPIPGKRNSDWRYAFVPVLGPVAGALLAGLVYYFLQSMSPGGNDPSFFLLDYKF
jgi:glycerol uptake facilitator protein